MIGSLLAWCRWCGARRGIARVAGQGEIQSWKSRGVDWVPVRAVPQVRSAEGNRAGGRFRRRGDPIVEIS